MKRETQAAILRALKASIQQDLKPELTSANARLRADLASMLLTRLAVEMLSDEAPTRDAPRTLAEIGDFAREQAKRLSATEAAVAQGAPGQSPVKSSGEELAIPPERFTAYLRARFPDDPDIRCTSLETVPGGRSKGTILVEVEGRSTPTCMVLRRDFEISLTGTSVTYEYPIIQAAFEAGLPAPPPLWLETDKSAIGGPFIAFEKVAGRPMGDLFNIAAPPQVMRDLAVVLARLHNLDVAGAGLSDHLDFARDDAPVRALLDRLHRRYRAESVQLPLLDAAFSWLWLRLDALDGPRALIHGDAAVHNLLGDNDRLTALLDWEFAHAGDPAEDLTYCKVLAERVIPWNEFMAVYLEHGGQPVSEARMSFFTVYRSLQLAVSAAVVRNIFESGGDQDLRLAAISYNSLPRHLTALADNLDAADRGAAE